MVSALTVLLFQNPRPYETAQFRLFVHKVCVHWCVIVLGLMNMLLAVNIP